MLFQSFGLNFSMSIKAISEQRNSIRKCITVSGNVIEI